MKLFSKAEPSIIWKHRPKNARRRSYKGQKVLQNRAVRRELNRDFSLGKEICARNLGRETEY